MSRIAVIGLVGESVFLSLERHQQVGETAHATDIHREWGGKGYNQAVAAARFGADVAFLGAASARDAEAIVSESARDGIRAYIAKKTTPTAYGVITTDKEGGNRVTVYGGAALEFSDVADFASEIAGADVLLINNEVPEEVNVEAVRIAKANGTKVIYNPAPTRNICKYLLANTDIFTPNEHEAEAISDFKNAIVTIGAGGCFIKWLGVTVPTFSTDLVVDTTGAGDTFSGVLSVMIAEGGEIPDACRAANAAATLEVGKKYVMPAIPHRSEVERFIAEHHKS